MDIYELVRGPIAWAALIVFLAGCVFRLIIILRKGHQKRMLYPLASIGGGFRSLLHGSIPFAAGYMRRHPLMTVISALFHLCLVVLPVFLVAHIVIFYESWQIVWWNLPDSAADVMTVFVMAACVFFAVRRLVIPPVKHLTRVGDFLLLAAIVLPFLTGFLAAHQIGSYRPMLILHVLSGELFLIVIPFSRLSHMLLFWLSRSYMGAEFGRVMKSRDW